MELLLSQNESLLNQQRELVAGIKKLMKAYQRERKDAERHTRTRKARDPTKAREPSGFLGVAHGSKLSRTEVTKKINSYIKTNNLQVPENKRSFKPDAKLSAILGNLQAVDAEKGYTYFNLQRYMTPHFVYATSA
jgi:chromatin remodeling complex protein RSC6